MLRRVAADETGVACVCPYRHGGLAPERERLHHLDQPLGRLVRENAVERFARTGTVTEDRGEVDEVRRVARPEPPVEGEAGVELPAPVDRLAPLVERSQTHVEYGLNIRVGHVNVAVRNVRVRPKMGRRREE